MTRNSLRLIIVRNDKLGDFVLAWPALALLKKYLPDSHVTVLVNEYTAPLARLCSFVDEVYVDNLAGTAGLARLLKQGRFDAQVTLFSTTRVALAGLLARIPYRLAPATKFAQIFYNHRLTQRRSRSEKPEYAYNIDLIWKLLSDLGITSALCSTAEVDHDWMPPGVGRPLLSFNDDVTAFRGEFCRRYSIEASSALVFIHPGSGGSATNLHPQQYSQLANLLAEDNRIVFVISAGPGEGATARSVAAAITAPCVIYDSAAGLAEYARTLQLADLFISGSTGPLHIAGALNRPTAAFYPGHRSATPLRWQTLNAPEQRLAFTPPPGAELREVSGIDIVEAARQIRSHFFHASTQR